MCVRCVDEPEWVLLDASSAGFFRVGDVVAAGTTIGVSPGGREVTLPVDFRVVDVQYDLELDELILALARCRLRRGRRRSVTAAA